MHLIEQMAFQFEIEGFGTVATDTAAGNIFTGIMPQEPDISIALFVSNSRPPGDDQGSLVQVIVRGEALKPLTALTPAQEIADTMEEWDGFLNGDGFHAKITVENGPSDIGVDSNQRPQYSINLRVYYCDI